MTPKHTLLVWGFMLGLIPTLFSQQKGISNVFLMEKFEHFQPSGERLSSAQYFEKMSGPMYLSPASEMVREEEVEGQNGYRHIRYQQLHSGVPIFGSSYVLHEKDGQVVRASGRYSPQVTTSVKPAIDAVTAMAFARGAMKAKKYDEKASTVTLKLIDPAFPEMSEAVVLAYQIDLVATEPYNKHRYFVDALKGRIICDFPLILHQGTPSLAQTKYYGLQSIITDSIAPQQFILRDPTRSGGIFVYHENGEEFTNTSSQWDLTNEHKDEVALDAHYCTQEYYDLMLDAFGWQGQDGQGKALKVRVHIGGAGFVNAYWDGEYSNYGDGDCNYGPLTTLEVVGHEFTHGMIDYTSKLVYDGESGAINESLADMFGKLLEYKSAPGDHSWALGHSFIINPESEAFRQMDDPNSLEMPAMYGGLFWDDGNGVHTNSSIGNLWYTMLVDGKQGVNEAGIAYQVNGIGFDKAAQIAFLVNRAYFTESSDYANFYFYSIAAAEEIYGIGSAEVNDVKEAWKAVGLPSMPNGDFDLSVQGEENWEEYLCGIGGFFPIKVKVTNRSSVAYEPAMNGEVEISHFNSSATITVPLDVSIAPGETYTIVLDNWLQITEPGVTFVDIMLNVTDSNNSNNFSNSIYFVATHESADLALYINTTPRECFATTSLTEFYVYNNSCQSLPAGTQLDFSATDIQSNLVWSSTYTLPTDLSGGATTFIPFTIPVVPSELTFTLSYQPDPELNNNQATLNISSGSLPITGNYLNNFEVNDGLDDYLQITGNSSSSHIYSYQASNFLGSTGAFEDETNFERCPDPFEAFDQLFSNGITKTVNACVDFSGISHPELSFDLVLFRNNEAQAADFLYSSMLQAKWEGTSEGKEYYFNQTDGTIEAKNIPLPAHFKGSVTLTFYTEIGDWTISPSSLLEDDVILVDNIRFSILTGTNDPKSAVGLHLYPNPAQDQVRIQAGEKIAQVLLQDLSGRLIKTVQTASEVVDLTLHEIPSGLYFVVAQLESGHWMTQKLVVGQ
ncbi:MAG: M4 family metallopeptidase [Saprospiraceae bacterium]|nr:M4 family metallopeptidase [Saprospiraceae bacterium]